MSDVSLIKYCMLLVQNFDFKSLLELCGILSVKYAKFVTDFRQGCQGLLTIAKEPCHRILEEAGFYITAIPQSGMLINKVSLKKNIKQPRKFCCAGLCL